MARATKIVTIETEGRDKGKAFLLTEMPPRQGEKWATRALLAIGRSGSEEMPSGWADAGMAGLAAVGVRLLTTLRFDDAEPLLDEMMTCVAFVPDPSRLDQMTRQPVFRGLIDDDIDEIATILQLRSEVIELHVGFSIAAFLSTVGGVAKAKLNLNDTPTSPKPSD